jgi:hypothetical protein
MCRELAPLVNALRNQFFWSGTELFGPANARASHHHTAVAATHSFSETVTQASERCEALDRQQHNVQPRPDPEILWNDPS